MRPIKIDLINDAQMLKVVQTEHREALQSYKVHAFHASASQQSHWSAKISLEYRPQMIPNQVVNTSIDSNTPTRVLKYVACHPTPIIGQANTQLSIQEYMKYSVSS
jgi:nitrate reductase cytochrome c-type subunit